MKKKKKAASRKKKKMKKEEGRKKKEEKKEERKKKKKEEEEEKEDEESKESKPLLKKNQGISTQATIEPTKQKQKDQTPSSSIPITRTHGSRTSFHIPILKPSPQPTTPRRRPSYKSTPI